MKIKIWDKVLVASSLQLKMFNHKLLVSKKFIPYVLSFILVLKSI